MEKFLCDLINIKKLLQTRSIPGICENTLDEMIDKLSKINNVN